MPIVQGGWLDVADWGIDDDTVWVRGTVASLPDRPATGVGNQTTVRWHFDGPHIWVDGAEGFYVHPRGSVRRDAEAFDTPDLTLRDDGALVDLGGAVRTRTPSLWVDTPDRAWGLEGARVDVRADTQDVELQARRTGRRTRGGHRWLGVGRAPRRGAGRRDRPRPGPWVPLASDVVEVPSGPEGSIDVVLPGLRGAIVQWRADDGRSGRRPFDPGGGLLGVGAGTYT